MLESPQKQALKIIYSDMDYHTSLFLVELDTLQLHGTFNAMFL